MIIKYKAKNLNIVRICLTLLFLIAGFSQFQLSSFKPSDLIISLSFLILLVNGKLRLNLLFIFFLISFIYAWLIGGLIDVKSLVSNTIIFSILFSLINYLKSRSLEEVQYYLKIFSFSMFISNALALAIFLFFPAFKELVVDVSSIGVRFKGFFTQANGYAYVLLINLPIALYFFKKNRTLLNLLNLLIVTICLLMAQSRGAILSAFLGLAIVFLIYLFRTRKLKKIFVPSLILVFLGYITLNILPNILQSNFGINLSRLNPTSEKSSERNIADLGISSIEDDRLYLVKAGLKTIETYPFGLGFQEQHLIIGDLTGVYLIPHNYFLSLVLTYGILISIGWLLIIGFLISQGLKTLFKEKTSPDSLFFYLTAMVLMVSIFYMTHSSDWSYFYFLIAIYVVLLQNKHLRIS